MGIEKGRSPFREERPFSVKQISPVKIFRRIETGVARILARFPFRYRMINPADDRKHDIKHKKSENPEKSGPAALHKAGDRNEGQAERGCAKHAVNDKPQ